MQYLRTLYDLPGVFLTIFLIGGCSFFSLPEVSLDASTDTDRDTGADARSDLSDVSFDSNLDDTSLDSTADMTPVAACGNQTIDDGEDCELGETIACMELGFIGGNAECAQNCVWDTGDCSGCDLYIDALNGDDAAAGTEENEAWQTLTNLRTFLATASATPDQTVVCLRRGTSYTVNEPLDLNWTGSSTSRLLIRDYGTELEAPIITGRTPAEFTLKDAANNIWNAPVPANIRSIIALTWFILDDERTVPYGFGEGEISPQMDQTIDYRLPDGMTPGETFFPSVYGVVIEPEMVPTRYVELRNLTFDAFISAIRINAELSDVSNITLDSNRFENSRTAWLFDERANRAMMRINIQRNFIENVLYGLSSRFAGGGSFPRDVLISENSFFRSVPTSGSIGILLDAVGGSISDNRFEAFVGTAIRSQPVSGGMPEAMNIAGNFITGATTGISDANNSQISNNIIANTDAAIRLVYAADRRTVSHNTTYDVNDAIQLYSMATCELYNNYFHSNGNHVFINDGMSSVISDHNVFSPNATILDQGLSRDLASWRTSSGNDLNSFEEAPMFVVMPPTQPEDFQITQGNASNNGTMTDTDSDFAGNPRNKTTPDIGAWETP